MVPYGVRPLPERRTDPSAAEPAPHDVLATAATRLRTGELSANELLDDCVLAIEKRDGELNAFAELHLEAARAGADHADRVRADGGWLGPLHGIPVTVKDVIDVAGMTTRCGSDAYLDRPARDAFGVAQLRVAGANILGKVTTHEFALGVANPQSRNPYDTTRIPGGSSGGSAISVATGMALASLGTDTRASIRVPSALCGLAGIKPTYGTVPTTGVVPLSWTMDHVGPIARTVRDAAIVLDVLTPHVGEFAAWASAKVDGWRLGAPLAAFEECQPAVDHAMQDALEAIRSLGCEVQPVARPTSDDLEQANAAGLYVSRAEAAAFHRNLGGDLTRYWPEVGDQLAEAGRLPAVDYLDAQRIRAELGRRTLPLFDIVDLLVMPTVPVVAPPVTDFARYLMVLSRNAIPWSFLGYPAVSVPCGTDDDGLPIGVQFVGPPGHDGPVIAMAAAFERRRRQSIG